MYRSTPGGPTWTVGGREIPIDAHQLELLGGSWARTDAAVWFEGVPVRGCDPQRFVVLGTRHGTDGVRVFWQTRPIPGADPATFRSVGLDHGADAVAVYDCAGRVEGAHPATFRVPDEPQPPLPTDPSPTADPAVWLSRARRALRDGDAGAAVVSALVARAIDPGSARVRAVLERAWDEADPRDEVPELRAALLWEAANALAALSHPAADQVRAEAAAAESSPSRR